MHQKFNPEELAGFARFYGFHYDICDPQALIRDCLNDMERGLRGMPSDLPMQPAYLTPPARLPRNKKVIALDAGGTNLRAALVLVDGEGRIQAESIRKTYMPGSRGQVSAEDFFSQIADLTAPLIEEAGQIDGIGFCFSYSIEITKDSDAVLISFSKEVDAPEVLGRRLGAGLKEALAARKVRIPDRIVLLNDAAATLLSGIAEMPPDAGLGKRNELFELSCGPVIGFILGTGFNTAYLEKIIPKIGYNSVDSSQIVVCETCRFHPRVLGYLDREFDATTKSPGTYVQEKASAGAYLGPLTLFVCKRAIKDGILQFRRSGELEALNTLQTADLNSFLKAPFNGEAPLSVLFDAHEGDALASLYYLASIIVERGSLLSAAILAATIERMDAGFNPFAPVRIAVEGTTYLAFKGMRESLESRLHVMLNQKKPRSCIIAPVQQASLFGAAIAALS